MFLINNRAWRWTIKQDRANFQDRLPILLAPLLLFVMSWPGTAYSQQAEFDSEHFDCRGIRRDGGTLRLFNQFLGGAVTLFSCTRGTCVSRARITTDDGAVWEIFRQVYLPRDKREYLSSWALWKAEGEPPTVFSGAYQLADCITVHVDEERWTLDLGEIRYADEEVQAIPLDDSRPSYFYAPKFYHRDWSGSRAILFEKQSSGGTYLPAYFSNIDGDVVLENGDLRATYEIPEHHTGEWRTFRVPLDGSGWRLEGGATSLAEILENVTGFRIRAEYGDGPDRTSMRNVQIE